MKTKLLCEDSIKETTYLKKIKTASEEFITHYKLTAIMGVVYLRKANGVAILMKWSWC